MIFDYLAAVPLRLPASAQGPQPLAGTLASSTQAGPALEPIVGRTAERPFSARLPHPAQQELPIAAALLDLAEHRLDNRFAPSVAPSSARRAEGAAHPIGHRQSRWRSSLKSYRHGLVVKLAVRRDQGPAAQGGAGRDVGLAAIARVPSHGPGDRFGIGEYLGEHRRGVLLVIRLISDVGGHNNLGSRIDGRLAVVPLHDTPLGVRRRHDPALRVGEVALGLRMGHRAEGLWRPPPARSFGLASRLSRLRESSLGLGLLFQHSFGGPTRLEPLFAPGEFGGQFIAALIRTLGRSIPRIGDLRLQPRFLRHHSSVAHRLVLRGIRRHRRAVQGDGAQLDQTCLLAEFQHLHKPSGQSGQMLFPKVADRPEIRPLVRRPTRKATSSSSSRAICRDAGMPTA